jgi:Zn-dependent peptidase ImmA (M78 family)
MANLSLRPEIIKYARSTARKDLEESAISLGLTSEQLETFEASKQKIIVRYSFLKRLSRVYKRPLAFFLLEKAPINLEPEKDFRTVESIKLESISSELALVIRSAQNARRQYLKLLEDVGNDYDFQLKKLDIHGEIASQADALRKKVGIPVDVQLKWDNSDHRGARRKWIQAVEKTGTLVFNYSIDIEEIRGFALRGHDLPPAVVYNSKDDVRASIFTIFHELAHSLLPENVVSSYKSVETFCNRIASEFLVPAASLRKHKNIETIREFANKTDGDSSEAFDYWVRRTASDYIVSKHVVLRKLRDIGLISEPYFTLKYQQYVIDYRIFAAQLEEKKQKQKERGVKGGGESPSSKAIRNFGPTYVETVLTAKNDGKISEYEASKYLGKIKTAHLGEVEELFTKRYDG